MTVSESLAKIEENKHLNAVIEINPDAKEIVAKEGILHGVPVLLKDNINTADKMHTTAGSLSLSENIAHTDAPAVRVLREAGAVIIGKANMTEFACYMSDSDQPNAMPNGYSSRGGQCKHPTHPETDPSGSSTGSAVAVAAGLCEMAVGSETYGSIISPSQHCGVVGLKPTDGLISKEGVIPISFTLDTLGPIANNVNNTAKLLSALTGREYKMKTPASEITVGIARWSTDNDEWIIREWVDTNEALIPKMAQQGMKIVEIPNERAKYNFTACKHFVYPIMDYEFQYAMNSYLQAQNNPRIPQNLKEIIAYNETASKYNQGTLIKASEVSDNWRTEPEYVEALKEREKTKAELDVLFDEFGADVLLLTSSHCGLPAAVGFPSLTLPIGKTKEGLPIGTMLMARRFAEDVLLSAARCIEGQIDHE